MGLEYKDYYKLLGVARDAPQEAISKAYKSLARKYHPDLNPNDSTAEDKFKEVTEAYEVLKDEEKRRMYDQLGSNWQHGQNFQRPSGFGGSSNYTFAGGGGGGFSDFFETIFGGGGASFGGQNPFGSGFENRIPRPRQGQDVETTFSISLENAVKGGHQTLSLDVGSGVRSFEVNIPAGVKNGSRIRLAKQGRPGAAGGPAGDLYLKVHLLPHDKFHVDDSNLLYDLALTPWEATLGIVVPVPTLDGTVELNIAPGTSSGRKLRLRGKGLGTGAKKGDLYIRVQIRVPDVLSAEEQALWEQLASNSSFKPREEA